MIEHIIVMILLTVLVVLTIGIIYLRDLLAAVILSGLYSLIAAAVFVVMDAVGKRIVLRVESQQERPTN